MANPAGDVVFLDTSILLAATDAARPFHATALRLIARGRTVGLQGTTSGQVIREYLAVATRPRSANGLGLRAADAFKNVQAMARRLDFCEESESISVRLRALVAAGDLAGAAVHDANIAATAIENGIEFLVTENPDDFSRYPALRIVRLSEVEDRLSAAGLR